MILQAITVTEPPLLTAVADSVDVLCFGDSTGSVSVTAQGGILVYDYLWNTGDITSTVNGLPSGFGKVTVTDTNGCTFVITTINQPSAPLSDTLIVTDNSCFGESLVLLMRPLVEEQYLIVMLGRMVKRLKISTAWQMVPTL